MIVYFYMIYLFNTKDYIRPAFLCSCNRVLAQFNSSICTFKYEWEGDIIKFQNYLLSQVLLSSSSMLHSPIFLVYVSPNRTRRFYDRHPSSDQIGILRFVFFPFLWAYNANRLQCRSAVHAFVVSLTLAHSLIYINHRNRSFQLCFPCYSVWESPHEVLKRTPIISVCRHIMFYEKSFPLPFLESPSSWTSVGSRGC